MHFVRPAGPADFDALYELAVLSGPGFTSLPEDEPTLRARLECSRASFAGELAPLESWYTLMIEDGETGSIDGVAGVKGAVGLKRPFFSFRVVGIAAYSAGLNVRFDHKALVLVNECAGWSEVGSLFLKAEKRNGGTGGLLAQSRYMLIAAEPARFAEQVLAELRGVFDEKGRSPFWEDVAHKFFPMPFEEADRLSASSDGQFILDLAPRHPIYVALLPERARAVVGQVHPDGRAAKALLEREGFRETGLIDIFDAGPTVACPRDEIRTLKESRRLRLKLASEVEDAVMGLAAVDAIRDYRAVRSAMRIDGESVVLPRQSAELLKLKEGAVVRIKA
jgi:arginine N-succinyltransferase